MFPSTTLFRRITMPLAGLALVLAFGAGCEEKVVRVENSWIGSQYDRIEADRRQRARKNWSLGKEIDKAATGTGRAIGNTGNALFGWTDDVGKGIGNLFTSDKKSAPRRRTTSAPASPMHERMTKQSTGAGTGY